MNKRELTHLNRLTERYPMLRELRPSIEQAYKIMTDTFSANGKVLVCGNGGSAADAEHIVGELMKGFMLRRALPASHVDALERACPGQGAQLASTLQGALPAISLVSHSALSTAFNNDVDPAMVFAQQVYGYGQPGDTLIGLTTSGNSANVVNAFRVAKAFGIKTIGLTGSTGGQIKEWADVLIAVPAASTPDVQELHLPIYHALCIMVEEHFFNV